MTVATDARVSSLDRMLDDSQVGDTFASDMFAVVDALEASATLRRAVTDPGTPESARQALVHGLLDGKVDQAVGELVVADRRADLEDTEDQLFRFARFVESNPDLRNVLGDRAIDRAKRQELVGELLRGRATDSTIALAQRAVAARERTFAQTIEGYVTLAAAQKNRVVATVRVAKPLSSDQRNRVVAALTKQIGRQVAIQEVIDPDILGGVRVELGDEVFEGTVSGRLEAARRLFE